MNVCGSNMTLVLVLGLFVVIATAHNITLLEVPQYGDPRRDAELRCYYVSERGDPPLHSVKWYKDHNEIFRFTPGQQPSTRSFNSTSTRITKDACNMQSCSIHVVLPKRFNTKMSYTCEVSTEGPRFAVVKQTKYLTVAVALKENPSITGIPGSVQPGEELLLNCSTAPAMPPANIEWFIDGKPDKMEPWMGDNTEVSMADEFGLRSSWRPLRLRVIPSRGVMALRCEATQPTKPAVLRISNASLVVARSPHLSMFTAYGSSHSTYNSGVLSLTLFSFASVEILSKFSALREV